MSKRDPLRRERIIRLIERAWLRPEHADTRLFQLLLNEVPVSSDAYNVEDDLIEDALRERYVTEPSEWKHPSGGPDWRYVPCNCGTAGHFIAFMPDPFDTEEVTIEFGSSRGGPWWKRLKWAFKHVFGPEDLVFADAIVSKARLVKVMEGLTNAG